MVETCCLATYTLGNSSAHNPQKVLPKSRSRSQKNIAWDSVSHACYGYREKNPKTWSINSALILSRLYPLGGG